MQITNACTADFPAIFVHPLALAPNHVLEASRSKAQHTLGFYVKTALQLHSSEVETALQLHSSEVEMALQLHSSEVETALQLHSSEVETAL